MKNKINWLVPKFLTPKTQVIMKKNEFLSSVLGREVMEGETLSAEDSVTLEAHLSANQPPAIREEEAPEVVEVAPTNPIAFSQEALNAAVAQAIAPLSAQLTEVSSRLTIVEGGAGATATKTPLVDGGEQKVHSWDDPNSPINKHSASFFEKK